MASTFPSREQALNILAKRCIEDTFDRLRRDTVFDKVRGTSSQEQKAQNALRTKRTLYRLPESSFECNLDKSIRIACRIYANKKDIKEFIKHGYSRDIDIFTYVRMISDRETRSVSGTDPYQVMRIAYKVISERETCKSCEVKKFEIMKGYCETCLRGIVKMIDKVLEKCPVCLNSDVKGCCAREKCGHEFCVPCYSKIEGMRCPLCRSEE